MISWKRMYSIYIFLKTCDGGCGFFFAVGSDLALCNKKGLWDDGCEDWLRREQEGRLNSVMEKAGAGGKGEHMR